MLIVLAPESTKEREVVSRIVHQTEKATRWKRRTSSMLCVVSRIARPALASICFVESSSVALCLLH